MTTQVPDASVYIVDDDVDVRDSLCLLLGLHGLRIEAFASAEEFLTAYRPPAPGCLVLDLCMSGMSGLELQARLADAGVRLPVIIITAHGDVATTRTALKAGAIDFLEKPVDGRQLLGVVRDALARDASQRAVQADHASVLERIARLTERERQVMEFVVQGRHNREIAAVLGISPRTVEIYKARMMEKMQARRLPDLIRSVLAATSSDAPR